MLTLLHLPPDVDLDALEVGQLVNSLDPAVETGIILQRVIKGEAKSPERAEPCQQTTEGTDSFHDLDFDFFLLECCEDEDFFLFEQLVELCEHADVKTSDLLGLVR